MPSTALPASRSRAPSPGSGFFSTSSRNARIRCVPASTVSPRKQAAGVDAGADVRPQRGLEALGLHQALSRRSRPRGRARRRAPSGRPAAGTARRRSPRGTCRRTRRSRSASCRRAPPAGRRCPWRPRPWTCAAASAPLSRRQPSPSSASSSSECAVSAGGVRVGVGGDEGVELAGRAQALHRGAAADAARVEARRCRRRPAARGRSRRRASAA